MIMIKRRSFPWWLIFSFLGVGVAGVFPAEAQLKTRGIWADPPAFTNAASTDQIIPIDPAFVNQELHVVQEQGCPGFVLYSYACMTDDTIAVVRKFSN